MVVGSGLLLVAACGQDAPQDQATGSPNPNSHLSSACAAARETRMYAGQGRELGDPKVWAGLNRLVDEALAAEGERASTEPDIMDQATHIRGLMISAHRGLDVQAAVTAKLDEVILACVNH